MKKEILHLFILKTCHHNCPKCCNKFYNIDEIPVVTVEELKEVHTVCLTGGEPFLYFDLNALAGRIKEQYPNVKNIYAYSSGASLERYLRIHHYFNDCLSHIDGVSVSPKNADDWRGLVRFYNEPLLQALKSNRLYVFDKDKTNLQYKGWNVIGRVWDTKFVTPDNEIFRRLPILLD